MTDASSPRERFVPADQVARTLGLGVADVIALAREGQLRGVEIGEPPRWRIDLDSVDAYLDDRSETARRAALWRQSQAASSPELWGRGDIRHDD